MTLSQGHLRTLERTNIYMMIDNSSKITMLKYQWNNFMVGDPYNMSNCIKRVEALGKLSTTVWVAGRSSWAIHELLIQFEVAEVTFCPSLACAVRAADHDSPHAIITCWYHYLWPWWYLRWCWLPLVSHFHNQLMTLYCITTKIFWSPYILLLVYGMVSYNRWTLSHSVSKI